MKLTQLGEVTRQHNFCIFMPHPQLNTTVTEIEYDLHPSEVTVQPRFRINRAGPECFLHLPPITMPELVDIKGVGPFPLKHLLALEAAFRDGIVGIARFEDAARHDFIQTTWLKTRAPETGTIIHYLAVAPVLTGTFTAANLQFWPSGFPETTTGSIVDVREYI